MAQLLFYKNPVAINKKAHKDIKVSPTGNGFGFAKHSNSVIVAGTEFNNASKEYAIVFSKIQEKFAPVVLLGVRNNENLFVGEDNLWDADYIPAFIRRYPYVIAEGGEEKDKLTVCIDEAYEGFNSGEGEPLFTEDGENTTYLQNVIAFLFEYRKQVERTEKFAGKLADLGLLTEHTAKIDMKSGDTFSMGGLMIVDEQKLRELDDAVVVELFRSGELAWIYSHLASLSNMGRLIDRIAKK